MNSAMRSALAGALALVAAPVLAKPAYVLTTVNLRAAPGTTSEIVGKIPGGSLIDADNCTEGWCAVSWQGKSGFAVQTALDLSGRVPPRAGPPPGYASPGYPVPDDEVVVEGPPAVYYGPGPYFYGYYGPRWGWGWHHRHW